MMHRSKASGAARAKRVGVEVRNRMHRYNLREGLFNVGGVMISTAEYAAMAGVQADATFRYGADATQYVDLYMPDGSGPHPVVVLVHGGCWREEYDAKPLGGICRALNAAGVAVWNLEYRRNGNGGGYPQTFVDVAMGTDLLRTAAAAHDLDLSRVISMGHSAGGQLALWLAGRGRVRRESPVYSATPLTLRGVVCLAGVVDLVAAISEGLCGADIGLLLGGLPEAVPAHYADVSPRALLPLGVPQIHLVGDLDVEMLVNARPYVAAAQAAGDVARLEVLAEAGHFEPVVSTTAAWERVRAAVLELLR